MGIQVVSSAMAAPECIQSSAQLVDELGKSEDWIVRRTGVRHRRCGNAALDSPELSAQAARMATEAKPRPDLLIYAGGVQRQALPDTSVFVARELGLEGTPCFSVNASCLSFMVALKLADSLLADGSYKNILICSTDIATLARDMRAPESAALLGDGAAAVMVNAGEERQGIVFYKMQTWSQGAELAEISGGGTRAKIDGTLQDVDSSLFKMDGRQLLKLLIPHLKSLVDECLAANSITVADIDLVVPHQASKSGFQVLERLGLPPEKTVNILSDYGNCVAAALPMALATAMAEGKLNRGDLVLLVGTAAGASAAVMLMRW